MRETRSAPLSDEECEQIITLVESDIHIDQAFRTLRFSFTRWDNSDEAIKQKLRSATARYSTRMIEKNNALLKINTPTPEPSMTVVREFVDVLTTLDDTDNSLIVMQVKAIMDCINDRDKFNYQMKNRLERLVDHRKISQETKGKLEFCLWGIFHSLNENPI